VSVDARLNVNVALNRPAYQSGTYADMNGVYNSANANDGNHNAHVYNGTCAHTTAHPNPWWAVDLIVPLYVYGVKFTNRGDHGGMYSAIQCVQCRLNLIITSSSAIAERPCCRVGYLWPKVEDWNWETIFTDIIGLHSTTVTYLASKAIEFGVKRQNKGYYAVQDHSK